MIHVVIVGRNCEDYARACIQSVKDSTVGFRAVVVDDNSTDGTPYMMPQILDKRFDLILTEQQGGPAHSRWLALNALEAKDEDIVVLLDMDDRLQNDALRVVEKYYRDNPDTDLTYGSCQMRTGKKLTGQYPDHVLKYKTFRRHGWRCFPLRTFRMGLFRKVGFTSEWFRYKRDAVVDGVTWAKKGEWFKVCTDVALMHPLMEKAQKIGHIEKLLYFYNDGLPVNGRAKYPLGLWHETNRQINEIQEPKIQA